MSAINTAIKTAAAVTAAAECADRISATIDTPADAGEHQAAFSDLRDIALWLQQHLPDDGTPTGHVKPAAAFDSLYRATASCLDLCENLCLLRDHLLSCDPGAGGADEIDLSTVVSQAKNTAARLEQAALAGMEQTASAPGAPSGREDEGAES